MTTSCPGFLDQYGIWNNGTKHSRPLLIFVFFLKFFFISKVSIVHHLSSVVEQKRIVIAAHHHQHLPKRRSFILRIIYFQTNGWFYKYVL